MHFLFDGINFPVENLLANSHVSSLLYLDTHKIYTISAGSQTILHGKTYYAKLQTL